MKKFKIITAFVTMSLLIAYNIHAQQLEHVSETFLDLVIPSGDFAGEHFDVNIVFSSETQFEIVTNPSWIVLEMTKNEVIDAIASQPDLTKSSSKIIKYIEKISMKRSKGDRKAQYEKLLEIITHKYLDKKGK